MFNIFIILLAVVCSGFAQLAFRSGLMHQEMVLSSKFIFSLFTNWYVIGGLILYFCSMILWFWVLSQVEVSYAYPFMAISFIIILIGGYFLGEHIGSLKIIGVGLILVGIFLVAKG